MRYLHLLIAVTLICGCSPAPQDSADEITKARFQGRWLVVNYWAEWCQPCRQEIPELNLLARDLADTVTVLGVNYDGLKGAELASAVTAMGIEFPAVGNDPAAQLAIMRPKVLPTTYILDAQGELVHTLIGPQSYQSLSQLVNSMTVEEIEY